MFKVGYLLGYVLCEVAEEGQSLEFVGSSEVGSHLVTFRLRVEPVELPVVRPEMFKSIKDRFNNNERLKKKP